MVDPRARPVSTPLCAVFGRRFPTARSSPDYAGIRPKLHGPGEAQGDFVIDDEPAHGVPGLVCLFGIESPGLTSSLAIGEEVARRLKGV